jgi:hypothetical protein
MSVAEEATSKRTILLPSEQETFYLRLQKETNVTGINDGSS